MRVTQCVYNSRTALYRVFVSPFEKVEALSRRSTLLLPTVRTLPPAIAPIPSLSRHASLIRRYKKNSNDDKPGMSRTTLPEDEGIRDIMIMVVDENNKLEGPVSTRKILESIDLDEKSLRMVSRAPRNPTEDQPPYAICKIIDRRVQMDKDRWIEKTRKTNARKAGRVKELEFNWAIAPHDLGHKLKQLKTFLQKGYKVDVLFAKKRHSRIATRDEAEALIESVQEAANEVAGVKEWRAREGVLLKVLKLYLSAPRGRSSQDGSSQDFGSEETSEETFENASEDASVTTSEEGPQEIRQDTASRG